MEGKVLLHQVHLVTHPIAILGPVTSESDQKNSLHSNGEFFDETELSFLSGQYIALNFL